MGFFVLLADILGGNLKNILVVVVVVCLRTRDFLNLIDTAGQRRFSVNRLLASRIFS